MVKIKTARLAAAERIGLTLYLAQAHKAHGDRGAEIVLFNAGVAEYEAREGLVKVLGKYTGVQYQ